MSPASSKRDQSRAVDRRGDGDDISERMYRAVTRKQAVYLTYIHIPRLCNRLCTSGFDNSNPEPQAPLEKLPVFREAQKRAPISHWTTKPSCHLPALW